MVLPTACGGSLCAAVRRAAVQSRPSLGLFDLHRELTVNAIWYKPDVVAGLYGLEHPMANAMLSGRSIASVISGSGFLAVIPGLAERESPEPINTIRAGWLNRSCLVGNTSVYGFRALASRAPECWGGRSPTASVVPGWPVLDSDREETVRHGD